MNLKERTCERCGRKIEFRKKWALNWEQVKYCSDKCRRLKPSGDFQQAILDLLKIRGAGKTICPSEVLDLKDKADKLIMEQVRMSARLLVAKGQIQILQNGKVVDPSTAKGLIRLKLCAKGF